jgi:hypothetical protein
MAAFFGGKLSRPCGKEFAHQFGISDAELAASAKSLFLLFR